MLCSSLYGFCVLTELFINEFVSFLFMYLTYRRIQGSDVRIMFISVTIIERYHLTFAFLVALKPK